MQKDPIVRIVVRIPGARGPAKGVFPETAASAAARANTAAAALEAVRVNIVMVASAAHANTATAALEKNAATAVSKENVKTAASGRKNFKEARNSAGFPRQFY